MIVDKAIKLFNRLSDGRNEVEKYVEVDNGIVLFTKHDNLRMENSMFLVSDDETIVATNPIISDIDENKIKPV